MSALWFSSAWWHILGDRHCLVGVLVQYKSTISSDRLTDAAWAHNVQLCQGNTIAEEVLREMAGSLYKHIEANWCFKHQCLQSIFSYYFAALAVFIVDFFCFIQLVLQRYIYTKHLWTTVQTNLILIYNIHSLIHALYNGQGCGGSRVLGVNKEYILDGTTVRAPGHHAHRHSNLHSHLGTN